MKNSTKDRMKGKYHEVKGAVKQKVGQMTGNRRLKVGGQVEKTAGKVQQRVGQIEGLFKK